VFHTGEAGIMPKHGKPPALETTPIVVDGIMYVSTPAGRIYALDPGTGTVRWRYDAKVDPEGGYGDFASRGVSYWKDSRSATARCGRRIFAATIDARLLALDAGSGEPCPGFGRGGIVDLRAKLRIAPWEFQAYEVTSPPAVVGDLVITGSGIADNSNPAPASGEVRAWDARTGALRWTFDPIPQSPGDPAASSWRNGSAARTGAANVWSIIASDPARDLVFLPTTSPAPDYYGGRRLGDNRYANSIVALKASTGKMVWHFQTVHHDLWDYDNASPPALTTIIQNGKAIPAVLQGTKTGMLFVLNRETGAPIFPVEERPVPRSDVPGEETWPTQPFTALTPPLSLHRFDPADAWGPTDADRAACRAMLEGLRNEGIFTPPSLQGTLAMPSNIGGAHWGGVAVDSGRAIAVVPVNRIPAMVQLIPDSANIDSISYESQRAGVDYEYTHMKGTGYWMRRRLILGPSHMPCSPPPFGSLVAVSLSTGQILWNVPLGTWPSTVGRQATGDTADGRRLTADGSPNLGGPILTKSGLIFIGATLDRAIRAYDVESGKELWRAALPAGARATPMTYEAGGRQFVVISAGGGDAFGAGDAIVAFARPVTGQ
jgi:quinoprotein glucose dehydrogenase